MVINLIFKSVTDDIDTYLVLSQIFKRKKIKQLF